MIIGHIKTKQNQTKTQTAAAIRNQDKWPPLTQASRNSSLMHRFTLQAMAMLMKKLMHRQAYMEAKLVDQEGRTRWDNLQIYGIPKARRGRTWLQRVFRQRHYHHNWTILSTKSESQLQRTYSTKEIKIQLTFQKHYNDLYSQPQVEADEIIFKLFKLAYFNRRPEQQIDGLNNRANTKQKTKTKLLSEWYSNSILRCKSLRME